MSSNEHTEQNSSERVGLRADVNRDLINRHQTTGPMYLRAVILFGILFGLGIVGFIIRLFDGMDDRAVWGYYAAVFAFILTTAQAAPMVSIATRLAKAHWKRPITRAAELWTLVGLFNLLLFIPMLWLLPDLSNGRRTLWFFDPGKVPAYSPHIWATAAIVALVWTGYSIDNFNAKNDRLKNRIIEIEQQSMIMDSQIDRLERNMTLIARQ